MCASTRPSAFTFTYSTLHYTDSTLNNTTITRLWFLFSFSFPVALYSVSAGAILGDDDDDVEWQSGVKQEVIDGCGSWAQLFFFLFFSSCIVEYKERKGKESKAKHPLHCYQCSRRTFVCTKRREEWKSKQQQNNNNKNPSIASLRIPLNRKDVRPGGKQQQNDDDDNSARW